MRELFGLALLSRQQSRHRHEAGPRQTIDSDQWTQNYFFVGKGILDRLAENRQIKEHHSLKFSETNRKAVWFPQSVVDSSGLRLSAFSGIITGSDRRLP